MLILPYRYYMYIYIYPIYHSFSWGVDVPAILVGLFVKTSFAGYNRTSQKHVTSYFCGFTFRSVAAEFPRFAKVQLFEVFGSYVWILILFTCW